MHLKHKGLSDARALSMTKKEHGFAVYFLLRYMKSLKSIYNEWLNAICRSSLLFGIFMIKQCIEFWSFLIKQCVAQCPKSIGTAKPNCVIKGR